MESRRSIFFFIDSLSGGGAERVCTLLANSFSKRAYNVTVVTIRESLSTDYHLAREVNRIALSANRKSGSVVAALKNNVNLILNLRKLITARNPEVVISLMTKSNVVCSLACINIDTIHIASERNYPPLEEVGIAWGCLRKYLYRLPRAIVSQTQKAGCWVEENTNCKFSAIIPNPVVYPMQPATLTADKSNCSPTMSNGQKVILGVGRLVDQKQFDSLIDIFSTFAGKHPEWILVIVGEGPNRIKLQQRIDSLKLQDQILLVGKQANMSCWYEQSDIFALTSKYEGYPNALLEAMCHGVSPVSYRCDTGPESIIQHGRNGILVPTDDEKQFASSVCKLIVNTDLREKMGNNAKEVVNSHSIESIVTQWESLFEH